MRIRVFPPPLPGIRPAYLRKSALAEMRGCHIRAVYWLLPWPQALKRIAAGFVWPAVAFCKAAFVLTPRCGNWVERHYGIPRWRQILTQVKIATTAQMPPKLYYVFELYRPEMKHRYHEYLLRNETSAGVFSILKSDGKPRNIFRDKQVFADECAKANIRHVPTLACFKDGAIAYLNPGGLPQHDLFLKPIVGSCGRHAERWRWNGSCYEAADGTALAADSLLKHIQQKSAENNRNMIMQAALNIHPTYAGLADGVLSTIRVLTCLDENMKGEVIAAVMRLSIVPGKVVDNFSAGGIGANIDLETGKVGPASNMGLKGDSIWHDVHPVTGAQINGWQVPSWPDVKQLAMTAHEKIGDRVVVGWDIAVLPDGPCLIEGNGRTSLDVVQRAGRAPLGLSRLGTLMAFHLRHYYPNWQEKRRRRAAGSSTM